MGEGQPRYSTEISDEYAFKYREKLPRTPGLFYGDDREVFFKSAQGLKYGLFTGGALAGFMITRESTRMLATAPYKAFRYGLPYVLAGATYGVTVGLVAKMRGKNDGWNHLAAGLLSGQILGSFYKSVPLGRWHSFIFAAGGLILKEFADADSLIFDLRFPQQPSLNFSRIGLFTKRPDPEGIKDSS